MVKKSKKKRTEKGEFTTLPKRLQYNSRKKLAIGTVQNKKRGKHLFIFFLIFFILPSKARVGGCRKTAQFIHSHSERQYAGEWHARYSMLKRLLPKVKIKQRTLYFLRINNIPSVWSLFLSAAVKWQQSSHVSCLCYRQDKEPIMERRKNVSWEQHWDSSPLVFFRQSNFSAGAIKIYSELLLLVGIWWWRKKKTRKNKAGVDVQRVCS